MRLRWKKKMNEDRMRVASWKEAKKKLIENPATTNIVIWWFGVANVQEMCSILTIVAKLLCHGNDLEFCLFAIIVVCYSNLLISFDMIAIWLLMRWRRIFDFLARISSFLTPSRRWNYSQLFSSLLAYEEFPFCLFTKLLRIQSTLCCHWHESFVRTFFVLVLVSRWFDFFFDFFMFGFLFEQYFPWISQADDNFHSRELSSRCRYKKLR